MIRLLITLTLIATLTACFKEHRVRVDQGVLIDQETLASLQAGLSKEQIRAVFGPPALSSFDANRWEYVFKSSDPSFQADKVKQVIIYFDDNGYVTEWLTPKTTNKNAS